MGIVVIVLLFRIESRLGYLGKRDFYRQMTDNNIATIIDYLGGLKSTVDVYLKAVSDSLSKIEISGVKINRY